MFELYHRIVYLSVLFLCFFLSLYYWRRDKDRLSVYLGLVCLIETLAAIFDDVDLNIKMYGYTTYVYIAYFGFYFSRRLPSRRYLIYVFTGISLAMTYYFFSISELPFPVSVSINFAMYYIALSLLWFSNQLDVSDSVLITEKQAFWVSTALLVWSVVFLFRTVPMYWLNDNDISFLRILDKIYRISVVVMYLLIMVGVTRKY